MPRYDHAHAYTPHVCGVADHHGAIPEEERNAASYSFRAMSGIDMLVVIYKGGFPPERPSSS